MEKDPVDTILVRLGEDSELVWRLSQQQTETLSQLPKNKQVKIMQGLISLQQIFAGQLFEALFNSPNAAETVSALQGWINEAFFNESHRAHGSPIRALPLEVVKELLALYKSMEAHGKELGMLQKEMNKPH